MLVEVWGGLGWVGVEFWCDGVSIVVVLVLVWLVERFDVVGGVEV